MGEIREKRKSGDIHGEKWRKEFYFSKNTIHIVISTCLIVQQMVVSEDIETLSDHLNDLLGDYKLFYDSLRRLTGEQVNNSLIKKSEEYLKNENNRLERMKTIYDRFSSLVNQICENYMNEVSVIEKEDRSEIEGLMNHFKRIKKEATNNNEELKNKSFYRDKDPSFVYKDGSKSKMNVELVKQYAGSYVYKEYVSENRTQRGDVFIDVDSKNDKWIVKYMKNDDSLMKDMKSMNKEERIRLLDDLSFLELPVKKDVIYELVRNEDNEMMEAWRNRKVVMVNGKNANDLNVSLKKMELFDSLFINQPLKNIQYFKQSSIFYINLKMKYINFIDDYLRNGKTVNKELIKRFTKKGNCDHLIDEIKMIGVPLSKKEEEEIKDCFYPERFVHISSIIDNKEYDRYLQKWAGNCKWKLIYRASEHRYKSKTFHDYCDDKEPTLIVIKSSEGWIFGGYTTQSWSGVGIDYDRMIMNR